jgi:hypothetical protein
VGKRDGYELNQTLKQSILLLETIAVIVVIKR